MRPEAVARFIRSIPSRTDDDLLKWLAACESSGASPRILSAIVAELDARTDPFCPHGIPYEFCGNCHDEEAS